MKRKAKKRAANKELTATSFNALPDAEKDRIYQEIEQSDPDQLLAESRPLNKRERAEWRTWQKRRGAGGRPRVGKGAQIISLSMERGLLKRADTFAKSKRLKRSEMVAQGLELLMSKSA